MAEVKDKLVTVESAKAIHDSLNSKISTHTSNTSNPHGVTKSQVGLGNVNNTSDANKPVSTAQATAIADAKKAGTDAQTNLNSHTGNKSNPHGVTLAQLGVNASAAELNYVDGVTSGIQGQLDALSSGKAPSGYGLGESASTVIDSYHNLDKYKENGTYHFSYPDGALWGGEWFYEASVEVVSSGDNCITQILCPVNSVAKLVRVWNGSSWGEKEVENPSMHLGVEYRTTERWNGNPVYTKLVSFGAMPNNGHVILSSKLISSEIQLVEDSYMGYKAGGPFLSMPFFGTDGAINARVHLSSDNNVYVDTFVDFSSYTLVAKFKYIKV